MKRLWMSGAAAVFAMSMASVGAQTPQNPPQQTQPPTQTPTQQSSATQEANTTLTGCVYKEADIPGRTPNVAERAGVMEDYILVTSTASATGTTGATGTSGTAGAAGTAGAMAAGKAFKLEHAADEKLSSLVGKRVEVTGRVDKGASATAGTTGAKPDTNPMSPDQIELPEFEVTQIKEVEGTCPTTPTIKK
jgi:hypothetical protein